MRPIVTSVGPLAAASANSIAASQTPGAAGALTLTSSPVTLDQPRRVLITAVGNETGKNFVITGTNATGVTQSETVAGPNATTAVSVLDYKTVTSITISAAAAGAITVGTNGVAASKWVRLDEWAPGLVTVQCVATGTVNYTVQITLDNPNAPVNAVTEALMTWSSAVDTGLVTQTTTKIGSINFAPVFVRVLLNSGTGTVTGTFLQSSSVPL